MSKSDPGPDITMALLFERGRNAFRLYLAKIPEDARPIGGMSMSIVCEADFVSSIALCMEHVRTSHATIYILDEHDDLSCLMGPYGWRR